MLIPKNRKIVGKYLKELILSHKFIIEFVWLYPIIIY
jgi:hypothetical protein